MGFEAKARATNPSQVQLSITLTAPVRDWEIIMGVLEKESMWPVPSLRLAVIGAMRPLLDVYTAAEPKAEQG